MSCLILKYMYYAHTVFSIFNENLVQWTLKTPGSEKIQVLEAAPTRESTEATTYDTTTPTTSLNILRSINILGPTTYQPSEPLNVEVVVLGKTVNLKWDTPKFPNGVISAYTVCFAYKHYWDQSYSETNCTNKTASEMDMTGNHFETRLSLLFTGAFFTFSVAAVNEMFTGRAISVARRTYESTPESVTGLYAQATNTTITVLWSRPGVPNGDIERYQLQWIKGEVNCDVFISTYKRTYLAREVTITPSLTFDPLTSEEPYDDNCFSPTPDPIRVNQENMRYTIYRLEHNEEYELLVTPFTTTGRGPSSNITQRTIETRPGPVGNVTIRDIESTAINVTWTIPEINPDPTNYIAVAWSMIPRQEHTARCEVEDYTTTGCVIENLHEFWRYKVEVIAKTRGGISEPTISEPFFTQESTPGKPTSFNVIKFTDLKNTCDATKINVTWSEPNLQDRNANITRYVVMRELRKTEVFTFTVDNPQPFAFNNRKFSLEHTGLTANWGHQWQLYAVGRNGVRGRPENKVFWTEECAPPKMDSHIEKLEITSSSVIFNLDPNFFKNEIQGKIVKYGMVGGNVRDVVKKVNRNTVLSLGSWSNFTSYNHQGAYRFTFNLIPIVNGKLQVEVGKNRNCRKEDLKDFCNGPLPSGLELWVKAYACTNVACTVSEHYGPFTIQQPHQDSNGDVDGALIALPILIAIFILISMFLVLWWRGAIDPLQWKKQLLREGEEYEEQETLQEIVEPNRSIPIATYNEALADLHRDTHLILAAQYEEIKRRADQIGLKAAFAAAKLDPNKSKNRWANILPFDHSRVKLQQLDDDCPESDYINANYLSGFHYQREYIATQGPLPGTIDDFWRMVWEQNVMMIVMLTQCKEGNKVKCEMYWPDTVKEPKQYGNVVVNPTSITNMNKFNINIFDISHATDVTKIRKVLQFHYLDFMDFTAAVEVDNFIEFVRTVRGHVPHEMTSPMVIHCSAGVGRTGSYIAIDRLQEYLNSPTFSFDDRINIFDMVMEMREQRVNMVQTESQYILIHDCFERMLEDKKTSLQTTQTMAKLAYDQQRTAL
ncbi:tyrosine-protein phosphatase 10D-like isoform X1 [Mya arenaria]|uniref:tyrosine-protein phosphatase 10D-like isoform X1 n=1 Tax=Mya arenaria TaxID=6604 RepID=UPI0022E39C0C|nr:tyrosine-protein phosphatase 10D-like isoform X1 [Mya arenaria]XP_052810152.1 tyrosine-protein phosphatase 10D-like isoform X1 [Mya arenaria]